MASKMSEGQCIDTPAIEQLCLETPVAQLELVPSDPSQTCWIDLLPDELLYEIFDLVHDDTSPMVQETRFPLALVCKRWQHVYCPLLFWTIQTAKTESLVLPQLQKVLLLLQNRPYLRHYPRAIYIQGFVGTVASGDICDALASTIKLCTTIQTVTIQTEFSPEIARILSACSSISHLTNAYLSGFLYSGPSLWTIFNHFKFSSHSLKKMSLQYYGPGVDRDCQVYAASSSNEPLSVTQDQLELLLPPSCYHTSNVTTMNLGHPRCHSNVTEHIVRWPARLTDLTIHDDQGCNLELCSHLIFFSLEVIQNLLNMHRSSLKRIALGRIHGSAESMSRSPDFSAFPHLKSLIISGFNIVKKDDPADAARKLSAPNLRCLTINFKKYGILSVCRRYDFQKEHAAWMKDFARLKMEEYPASKLVEVVVDFRLNDPKDDPHEANKTWHCLLSGDLENARENGVVKPITWPWEHLEEAKEAVAEFGVNLTYDPNWTKEEWDRIVYATEISIDDVLDVLSGLGRLLTLFNDEELDGIRASVRDVHGRK